MLGEHANGRAVVVQYLLVIDKNTHKKQSLSLVMQPLQKQMGIVALLFLKNSKLVYMGGKDRYMKSSKDEKRPC